MANLNENVSASSGPKGHPSTMSENNLTMADLQFLQDAAKFFADPGLVAKSLAWAGKPVESFQKRIPEKGRVAISAITERAIRKAIGVAVRTIPLQREVVNREEESALSSRLHRGLTAATGAAGGMFGLASLAVELPITTVLILRGISDQARLYGHDLNELETRLECLMIFTMGVPEAGALAGEEAGDQKSINRYLMTRATFVGLMREAVAVAGAFTTKGLTSGPILSRLVAKVAEKFQVRVSQKFLAESVPLVGALGGGALNYAFTDFFVTAARYHFGIRALEKKHGEEIIQDYLKSVDVSEGAPAIN